MITAKDELLHVVECMGEDEANEALTVLGYGETGQVPTSPGGYYDIQHFLSGRNIRSPLDAGEVRELQQSLGMFIANLRRDGEIPSDQPSIACACDEHSLCAKCQNEHNKS